MQEFSIDVNYPSFISGWVIDEDICDQVIDFFREDNYFPRSPGMTTSGLNKEVKDSIDKVISNNTNDMRMSNYFTRLSQVLSLYLDKYQFSNSTVSSFCITETVNIQMYNPGGGFKSFHTERDGSIQAMNRHLAFMTYLNDVNDGGETEWYYQQIKIKPKKGLTLFWPVDWTHTHRGIPSPTEEKYIITGWYNFK
jgi:hypothetical protein